ncbi:S-layer family protein [Rivularia sp. UHCC 0363]|uniref:S-layer family protein n=1 Tax=Rivularia sp. UHCC 0363 TaxID=3110244 RepID=UPI002B1F295E|nr:S-layer family protein [Rivularia sp. UHCC 0363]MEA5596589.1 S-layer family protein [Rivularia sp. UHCC 0363]
MKGIAFVSGLISSLLTSGIFLPAYSQVTSDGTTNTTVNPNGNNFDILNGIQKGNNLFHSFKEFSIPTGSSATFNNSTDVVNIINRVTGGNISNIDGLIKANGSANLFLINPAGIVFGENARLDIGGSFLGSTAESLLFQDGFEFSAVDPTDAPLLTVSVPLGLQMGQNPGDIKVEGNGHNVTLAGLSLLQRGVDSTGLQVTSGNNITLVGGNISLDGGLLVADSGNIELAALSNGEWKIGQNNSASELKPTASTKLGNINLLSSALIDVSGINAGSAYLRGKQIELQNGSAVISQNLGEQIGGDINVQASEQLKIIGSTVNLPTLLGTQTLGTRKAGDINVNSPSVLFNAGGAIQSQTFSSAQSGNINVQAPELLEITGLNTLIPSNRTGIANAAFSSGDTGNINVSTGRLIVRDGSTAGSLVTLGTGNTGEVVVNASESIELSGSSPVTISDITAVSFGEGNGGNVIINTPKLTISNGAGLGSGTFASGNAGNVIVNAFDVIEIIGDGDSEITSEAQNAINSAAVSTKGSAFQALLGLPDEATGDGGNVTINTPRLNMKDNARISVGSDSTGKAGSILINVDTLSLDNGTEIVASTASGNGGNIDLNLQEILLMRRGSLINTEAKGAGNGGNITINSPVIAGFENSDIIANAVEGNGGNINITTQGIFGLEFRDSLTEESDITASSQFGVNGTVDINNFGIDPSSGLVELSTELTDSSQQVATGCSSNKGSSFVATGRGGIPQNPTEQVDENLTWSDVRDLSAYRQRNNNIQAIQISNKSTIIEATGFIRNENGEIEFIAAQNTPFSTQQVAECSGTNS